MRSNPVVRPEKGVSQNAQLVQVTVTSFNYSKFCFSYAFTARRSGAAYRGRRCYTREPVGDVQLAVLQSHHF